MSATKANKTLIVSSEMTSDWHIGTGAGIPGSIDALLARDADGFPCVPAKTIVGIWRDAMETLTLGLDGGPDKSKTWQRWVDVVFGSQPNQLNQDEVQALAAQNSLTPRPSILSIEPARLNEYLRGAIGNDERLKQALTFIKPNTQIDFHSGTAKTESLRFTEMGRIGTVLEANVNLRLDLLEDLPNDRKELIEALLVASAALVERIGGNRRRGSGKCEMQLTELMSKEKAVEILRSAKDEDIRSIPTVSTNGSVSPTAVVNQPVSHKASEITSEELLDDSTHAPNGNKPTQQTKWKRINYSLKLQTPVAIVTNTLGNVSETLDFIPGTYLLPHIAKKLKGISKHLAVGDFQVSPATIEVDSMRGLPVPRVFLQEKMNEARVYNRLRETEESFKQPKPLREGFISTQNGNFTHFKTPRVLLMHNTVEDSVQRPTENVGGVFSRQAIKAGTTLRGEIRLKETIAEELSKQDEKWYQKLSAYVRLGTSKKDDYGLAELSFGDLEPDISSAAAGNAELFVYLESDVLLRNGNLRQSNLVEDLKTELENTLGKGTLRSFDEIVAEAKETLEDNAESKATLEKASGKESLIQVRRIESWHEGWGFPRPTLTAMAAGSVVVFKVIGSVHQTTLRELELSGIGERRGEGYGRIRFDPPLLMSKINEWAVAKKAKPTSNESNEALAILKTEIDKDEKLSDFVSIIELAAWRDELARAVLKIANVKDKRKDIFGFEIEVHNGKKISIPSLSQIGGLRSTINKLSRLGDSVVIGWIAHLEATGNRLEKWAKNKDKEKAKQKLQRIQTLIESKTEVWEKLKQKDSTDRGYFNTPSFATPESDMQTRLWAEAVGSLFDACARAHKRDVEPREEKKERTNG